MTYFPPALDWDLSFGLLTEVLIISAFIFLLLLFSGTIHNSIGNL